MKANNPITARVQAAFKNLTTPTNQEVTLNADGSGGPIVAPDGRVVNEPKKKNPIRFWFGCQGTSWIIANHSQEQNENRNNFN